MFDIRPSNRTNLVNACHEALKAADAVAAMICLLQSVVSRPHELAAVPDWSRSEPVSSARYDFLYESQFLTVMLACLPPGFRGPAHNHLAWAVIGLYEGRESQVIYRRGDDGLVECERLDLAAPCVVTLAPEAIHRVANPGGVCSAAIHIYGGRLANPARSLWNPFTESEEKFQASTMAQYEFELTRFDDGRCSASGSRV